MASNEMHPVPDGEADDLLSEDPQPESQGETPLIAGIGDEGQGDLSPEDY